MNFVNRVFIILAILSCMAVGLTYYVWNSGKTEQSLPEDIMYDGVTYGIDKCHKSGYRAYVKGWAFNSDNYPRYKGKIDVYIKTNNSRYIKIMTRVINRPDVSKHFKLPGKFDKSGFYASSSFVQSSGEYVMVLTNSGVKRGFIYACK